MNVKLKIKSKSLAAEARIIRKEELKLRGMARSVDPNGGYWHPNAGDKRSSLHLHRTVAVRRTARATHLARAFLMGTPYKDVERSTREELPVAVLLDIAKMVTKYGGMAYDPAGDKTRVTEWLATA